MKSKIGLDSELKELLEKKRGELKEQLQKKKIDEEKPKDTRLPFYII